MQPSALTTTVIGALLAAPAMAGTEIAPPPAPAASNSGDWCSWLQSKPGTLYKNADNPILQGFHIGGRFQWQAAYVDGRDANGDDFHDGDGDFRRFRLESKTDFLRFFTAKVNVNLVNDQSFAGGDTDWGYDTFDEALLSFDIGKAFGSGPLDSLKLNYGRHKFVISEEARMSSKEIITIERSAISNKVYGSARPTGVTIDAAKGPWTATFGVFSGEDDSEFIGGWNDGEAYYFALGWKYSDTLRFTADYVENNPSGADDFLGYERSGSLNAVYESGRVGFLGSLIAGDNGDRVAAARQGDFFGVVAMPWYWLVDEKLQAVFQYQLAVSDEPQGLRLNSRYLRDELAGGGRGDEHHSAYLGVNYYLCGHNAKVMAGVQYDHLDTPAGSLDGLSWLVAFRTAF